MKSALYKCIIIIISIIIETNALIVTYWKKILSAYLTNRVNLLNIYSYSQQNPLSWQLV